MRVSECAIFLRGLAHQWRPQKKRNWHKGSLGDEDDGRTLNTCIAQRKRAIDDENVSQHVTSVLVTALCNQPETFTSDLSGDQSRYFCIIVIFGRQHCENNAKLPT